MSRRQISTLVFSAAIICTAIGGLTLVPMLSVSIAAQEEDPQGELGTVRVDANEDETPNALYLRLIQKKLQLISPDELANEIQKLRMELAEREAFRKLEQASQQLQDLIDQHPNSRAAQNARRMLQVERRVPREEDDGNPGGFNPNPGYTTGVPEPDEDVQPVPVRARERKREETLEQDDSPYPQEPRKKPAVDSPYPQEQRRKPTIAPDEFRRPRNPKVDNNS